MEKPRYYFVDDRDTVDLDFTNLGFNYLPCPYRFEAVFKFGVWRVRGILDDTTMHLPEGSQCLHYGQQLFEGMKVQRGPDGRVYAFRPLENARRMNQGAAYLQGPAVPEDLFVRGIEEVTLANLPFVPPHGSGAALYLRPMYLGIGDNVGVKPANEYVFRIFVTPVGPYYKGGFGPDQDKQFMVSQFDRARELEAQELASPEALDRATADLDAARSSLDQRRARLDELLAGTTIEELAQAENAVLQAAARLESATIDLERHTIRAPTDGITDARLFELGERPSPGQPVMVMLGGEQPYARIFVPESVRAQVSSGLGVRVFIDGIDEPVDGRVRWVSSEAAFTPYFALTEHDRSRLSFVAKVDLLGLDRRLPDGVPVEVELGLGER